MRALRPACAWRDERRERVFAMMGRGRWLAFDGLAVVGSVAFALTQASVLAQSSPDAADAFRPLGANAEDVREGRELANKACANCHGAEGISAGSGVPHLAGQRPSYVYSRLKAYRAGGDGVHHMQLMNALSSDALANVAAYYASLDPAPPSGASVPGEEDPIAAGKSAAAPCARCHGENGVSRKEGVPSLIGLHPKYLVESMKAYKEGDRPVDDKNADMKKALDALNNEDLKHVALYYALQSDDKLTHAQTPSPGGPPASKAALTACVKCHGEDGIGSGPVNPSLAGQDATYMLNALRAYKTATRDDDVMTPKVKNVPDDQLKAFAVYYAGLNPKPLGIFRPLNSEEWAEKCDRCHGVNGNSVRPEVPALAAQRGDYLEKAIKAYRSGVRMSPEMAAMSSILTDDDIAGLAAHYAHEKGRPVVFIPVPEK
jgi:cytochrome c553